MRGKAAELDGAIARGGGGDVSTELADRSRLLRALDAKLDCRRACDTLKQRQLFNIQLDVIIAM